MTVDTTKTCFKMFDGAAKHTIEKMSTPDIKELIETLTEEINAREDIKTEEFSESLLHLGLEK